MTGIVLFVLFVALGVLHLVPAAAAIRPQRLTALYGVQPDDTVLLTLLQHRAVMLGIVGLILLAGAVHPQVRWISLVLGVLSMGSFLLISRRLGTGSGALAPIYKADIAGLGVAALAALVMVLFGSGS